MPFEETPSWREPVATWFGPELVEPIDQKLPDFC